MLNLVTGGAGFLGSHICNYLIKNDENVICLDDLSSGKMSNLKNIINNKKFSFIKNSVLNDFELEVDNIWHFACSASPSEYVKNPVKTNKLAFIGTSKMLELAKKNNAKFLLASSSEIYGNPRTLPQKENIIGDINHLDTRACYAEAKKLSETLTYDYRRMFNLDVKIARIFNTYGSNMSINDGRVMATLIMQGLKNEEMTINGDGKQTRSFCFVDDLIEGLMRFMKSDLTGPYNFGGTEQISILDLAKIISKKLERELKVKYCQSIKDEPKLRCPCIKKVSKELNWEPKVDLDSGLSKTIKSFKTLIN